MVKIFPMSAADHDETVRLLTRAFAEDPHINGLFPAATEPARRQFFEYVVTRANHSPQSCDIAINDAGSIVGAALWEHPEVPRAHQQPVRSTLEHLMTLPLLLRIFGDRLSDANRTQEAIERARPEEPHWYLKIIGTDPAARGTGAGKALLAHRVDQADRTGAAAYLESSAAANISYYERFGFICRGEIPAFGTPNTYGMWRPVQR